MKIHGKTFSSIPIKEVVITHGTEPVLFTLQAILDYSEFDALCPIPLPPKRVKAGGETTPVFDDPAYNKLLNEWAQKKSNWMFMKSLAPTEGLEWDNVDQNDPATWSNVAKEMRESGFTDAQLGYLMTTMAELNGLDQKKIDQATKDFLAGRDLRQKALSSLGSEPSSTQSGEPASE